ncbi:MAG: AMIN domain-containing protein, partial [Hydrocarboniphaga effusa]|nr:AMIN domain-containing protein [Hydrocarboniphaga effusa]
MKQTHHFTGPAPGTGLLRSLALCSGLLLVVPVLAQDTAPAVPVRTLNALDVVALDGDRVLVTLTLSETAPEPVIFTVDKPARLSLDLADTKLALPERFKRIGAGKVRSVAAAEAGGRSRIVIELSGMTPYNVRTEGNKVLVEIQGGAAVAGASAPVGAPSALPSQILSVDFRRGE